MRSKRWILMTLWIAFLTLPMYAQASTPAANEWPRCYTEAEWAEQAAAIDAEQVRTAEEAVAVAVTPLLAEKAGLVAGRDAWKAEAEAERGRADRAEAREERLQKRGKTLLACSFILAAATFAAGLLAGLRA